MKSLLGLFVFLVSSLANAATVTIDFDEVTPQSGSVNIVVATQGYTFSTGGISQVLEASVSDSGIYLRSIAVGGPGSQGFGDAGIRMVRDGGGPFAIHTLDAFGGSYSGLLANDVEADLSAPVGTGDWLNLVAFDYGDFGVEISLFEIGLDDIVVTAVPIPAAAWLFGSALAGLGWMRRKQAG